MFKMEDSDDKMCAEISSFTEGLIRDKGYPLEIYQVETEDGYINSLYRIPHGLSGSNGGKKRNPVLIVHGLISSVADSVQDDRFLSLYLANNGFDVWMANCRGTTYSRGHVKFHHKKQKKEYWNFSWHEIGYYDIPAFIDYILEKTGSQKLSYVGISQGCTVFSVLMSTRPEYNAKISLSCLLCPGIILDNASPWPTKFLFSYFVPWLKWVTDFFNTPLYEAPFTQSTRKFGVAYAKPNSFGASCFRVYWDLFGGHRNNLDDVSVDYTQLSRTTPNSASFKQLLHFSQIVTERKFAQFDYGTKENMKRYGSESSPFYDLSKVTAPVALFYSKNDMFYATKDIDTIAERVGNCVHKHLVEHEKFNHLDFVVNKNVIPLVYDHVLKLMKKYTT